MPRARAEVGSAARGLAAASLRASRKERHLPGNIAKAIDALLQMTSSELAER